MGAVRRAGFGLLVTAMLVTAIVFAIGPAAANAAATWTVNTTTDNAASPGSECAGIAADCSLRQAIDAAASGDTISVPAGHYILTLGELSLSKSLTIQGAGARTTILDANSASRVFDIPSGVTASVSEVTVTGGSSDVGGGIKVLGTLNLTNSTVSGNKATVSGGGIDTNGTVNVTGSTISGNSATGPGYAIGGGIDCFCTTVSIVNSTIAGNTASGGSGDSGGGILYSSGNPMTLVNVTIAGNTAGKAGGGIDVQAEVDSTNTIIAGNTPANCDAPLTSKGHNLSSDHSCAFTGTGDLQDTDPMLATLANNGGDTDTEALLSGSPAIDAGDDVACPTTDQRGVQRPQGAHCDIGSFELVRSRALTLSKSGSGSGGVTSSPAGIDCGGTCSASFTQGTVVTLTAAPAADSTFTGWSGGVCTGTGTCTLTMSADTAVTASFALKAPSNSTPPSISGTPAVGHTLTCDHGTWSPTPASYTYQWDLDGTAVSGATNQTLVVAAADQAHKLTCVVTAIDNGGSNTATSAAVSVPAVSTATLPTTPTCTVTSSGKVAIAHAKRHGKRSSRANPSAGVARLPVTVTCDQAAKATLSSVLVDVRKRKGKGHKNPRPKRYRLATINSSLAAGTATALALKLPASAVNDLLHGASETVTVILAASNGNGTARVTVALGPLTR